MQQHNAHRESLKSNYVYQTAEVQLMASTVSSEQHPVQDSATQQTPFCRALLHSWPLQITHSGPTAPTILSFKQRLTPVPNARVYLYF